MNEKEFKIVEGNWYTWQGIPVLMNKSFIKELLLGYKSYRDIEKIPLSEELILNIGAEKPNKGSTYILLGCLIWKCNNNMYLHDSTGVMLQTLDQLQDAVRFFKNKEIDTDYNTLNSIINKSDTDKKEYTSSDLSVGLVIAEVKQLGGPIVLIKVTESGYSAVDSMSHIINHYPHNVILEKLNNGDWKILE